MYSTSDDTCRLNAINVAKVTREEDGNESLHSKVDLGNFRRPWFKNECYEVTWYRFFVDNFQFKTNDNFAILISSRCYLFDLN